MMQSILKNPNLSWLLTDEIPPNLSQVISSQYIQLNVLEDQLHNAEEKVEDLKAELRLNRQILIKLEALAGKKPEEDLTFHL